MLSEFIGASYDEEGELLSWQTDGESSSDLSSSTSDEGGVCDVPGCPNLSDETHSNLPDSLRQHLSKGYDFPEQPLLCANHRLSCCANVACGAVIMQVVYRPVAKIKKERPGVVVQGGLDYKGDPPELCSDCFCPATKRLNDNRAAARKESECISAQHDRSKCKWRYDKKKLK